MIILGEKTEDKEIPEVIPEITPRMVETTLSILESRGLVHYMGGGAYVPTEGGWKLLQQVEPAKEEINAYGHPDITATHTTAIGITREGNYTKDGNCIIGVRSDKSCTDFDEKFKIGLKNAKKVEIRIKAGIISDKIIAYGSPALILSNKRHIVIRKGDFIDDRTAAILADKAACDLKRNLIKKIKNPKTEVKIILEIKP